MKKLLIILMITVSVITACSTMTTAEKEQKRSELDGMAEEAMAGLIEQNANIKTDIDSSVGYAVANMKLTKVPIVGAGGGEGVLVIKDPQQRIYFTVGRFDVGGGWGARSYKMLIVFSSQKVLDDMKDGIWEFQAGAEASAGAASLEGSSSGLVDRGFSTYVLSDGGASATVTARAIRTSVNRALTDNE